MATDLLIGTDFDGVLCKPLHTRSNASAYLEELRKAAPFYNAMFYGKELVIVTARRPSTKPDTMRWLEENGVKVKRIHFFEGKKTAMDVAKWKATVIKAEGLQIFYEDYEPVVRYLRKALPGVKIVQVHKDGRLT